MATEASPEALLARGDLDLVVIPTPNDSHAPLARAALLAGCHVVVDKPFTLNAAEAASLVALAAERQKVLSVFHNRRWDNDFLAVREVLASGVLGRLVQVQCHFDRFRPTVLPRWPRRWRPRQRALARPGLAPARPGPAAVRPVRARSGPTWQPSAAAPRPPTRSTARLRYDDGLRVSLHASTLAALPGPRFALHGTRGSLRIDGLDPQESALKSGALPGAQAWGADTREAVLALASAEAPNELHTPSPALAARQLPRVLRSRARPRCSGSAPTRCRPRRPGR